MLGIANLPMPTATVESSLLTNSFCHAWILLLEADNKTSGM